MSKLNFKISELIYSDTAIKHNINNMPDINSLDCLLDLIFYCLQPIRDLIGKPMIITSGYRNKEVNKLVNGKSNSQHLKGQAADFIIKGLSVKYIIDLIRSSNIEYDQLIEEHSYNSQWVHISYNKKKLRHEILKYINGKYIKI